MTEIKYLLIALGLLLGVSAMLAIISWRDHRQMKKARDELFQALAKNRPIVEAARRHIFRHPSNPECSHRKPKPPESP